MQFIDLDRQYKAIKDNIDRRIKKVIDEKKFIMGPEIEELEKRLAEFTDRKYAFTCSSGTDALIIPLLAYKLKEGDAVFVPSFTFFATAETVSFLGGTPVFVDSDKTYNIDTVKLEETIKKVIEQGELNPRGIISVDLFGLPADHDEIQRIADKYNLFVIEDAAQGFGGIYKDKRNCHFGNVSATSFFPAKPLGCYGDGGAVFTDDDELAELMHSYRVHGHGKSRYDNIRIGINGRLDTIQAAVLNAKLDVFEDEFLKRNIIAAMYKDNLAGAFELPVIPDGCVSSWAQFTLMTESEEKRDRIIEEMKKYDIPIMVYYPIPMHMQTVYKPLGYKENDLPVCADMSRRVFSVPMHPYLTKDEIIYISEKLKSI